jgi:hypothetical protein
MALTGTTLLCIYTTERMRKTSLLQREVIRAVSYSSNITCVLEVRDAKCCVILWQLTASRYLQSREMSSLYVLDTKEGRFFIPKKTIQL